MRPIPGGGLVQSSLQTRRQNSDVRHSQRALLPDTNKDGVFFSMTNPNQVYNNFDDKQNFQVYPLLIIRNNDVASIVNANMNFVLFPSFNIEEFERSAADVVS